MRIVLVSSLLMFGVYGCGDCFSNRQTLIMQRVTAENLSRRFEIDTSSLPATWIEERRINKNCGGQEDFVMIGSGHHVRIVLVPEPEKGS